MITPYSIVYDIMAIVFVVTVGYIFYKVYIESKFNQHGVARAT